MDVDQHPSGGDAHDTEATEGDRSRGPQAARDDDALATLQHRLDRSQAAQDLALQELRAVMSDSDAHRDYGIDTNQI
jgi:hypothetical protein